MIVPMVPEVRSLLQQNNDSGKEYFSLDSAPFPFWINEGKSCGIVACGQGKVQAALAASWSILHALQEKSPKLFLFGTAGSNQLAPGTLCLANSCEEYDFLVPGKKPRWPSDKGQSAELHQAVKQSAEEFFGSSSFLQDSLVMSADQDYPVQKSLATNAETNEEETPGCSSRIYTWESAGFWRSVSCFTEFAVAAAEIRVVSDSGWGGSLKEFQKRMRQVIQPVSGFMLSLLETAGYA